MRVYNFNTKKIYESDGTFNVSIEEIPLRNDVTVKQYDDQTFYAYDEAIRSINDFLVPKILGDEGFETGDYDIEDDGMIVTVTVPNYKTWKFVLSGDALIECLERKASGNSVSVNESLKEEVAEETSSSDETAEEKNESVAERFAAMRKMFEAADEDEDSPESSDKNSGDEDSQKDDSSSDDTESEDKDSDEDAEDEDKEMTAIVLTVAKGDGEKLKQEILDSEGYDIAEDSIEVIEGDDDSDEDKVKIDASEAFELKKFLKDKKDIDLEEEIGGEIVDTSDEEGSDDEDSKDDSEDGGSEDEEDFDFDSLGDIFGAEDEGESK